MKRSALLPAFGILTLAALTACGSVENSARDEGSTAGSASTDEAGEREERLVADSVPKQETVAADSGVLSLDDFARSPFCRTYGCSVGKSWDLRDGGMNHTYDIPADEGLAIDVQVEGGRVVGAGLSIYGRTKDASGRTRLHSDDLAFADALVRTFLGHECAAAERLIRDNVTSADKSVVQAPAARCGDWTIQAAQVLNPVISLERSK